MRALGGVFIAVLVAGCGCGPGSSDDGGVLPDGGLPDGGAKNDGGVKDGGPLPDGGHRDAGLGAYCGDHLVEAPEECDDGNRVGGDGCSAVCRRELRYDGGCGDGIVTLAERCDDGNLDAGDGCDPGCRLETGYRCPAAGQPCTSRCGDGILIGLEQCDDGNTMAGDGCTDECRIETGYECADAGVPCAISDCGDSVVQQTESCDDGNSNFDDMCSPICTRQPACGMGACLSRCGDRVLQAAAGESCDDGDTRDGDGCSSTCQVETGFTCALAPPPLLALPLVIRDFHKTHPDFEEFQGPETGIVQTQLGADGKPQYSVTDGGHTSTTTGKADFDQWYNDTAGVNVPIRKQLPLVRDADGGLEFGSDFYFPIDGEGFGAEGFTHNYHFTDESRIWFIYRGNEELLFVGDDDVFIYVNGTLVVDLGGVHSQESGQVVLDSSMATTLNLQLGSLYEVAFFHAERHTVGSTFHLTLLGFDFVQSRCVPTCGDGVIGPREECDDGKNDGGYAQCGPTCQWNGFCGDGVVQSPGEDCDDGVNAQVYGNGGVGCTPSCHTPHFCGDGVIDVQFEEQCDDDAGGCNPNCTLKGYCGDGTVQAPEQCDDGNLDNTDSCWSDCTFPR